MPTFEGLLLLIFSVHIHIIYIPSFRLVGGFLVAQLVRIDLEPSHCPFIRAIAFSASTFFVNETNPYPFDFKMTSDSKSFILGDPEVTENIYCKSRNLPNTDTQNYSTDLR